MLSCCEFNKKSYPDNRSCYKHVMNTVAPETIKHSCTRAIKTRPNIYDADVENVIFN